MGRKRQRQRQRQACLLTVLLSTQAAPPSLAQTDTRAHRRRTEAREERGAGARVGAPGTGPGSRVGAGTGSPRLVKRRRPRQAASLNDTAAIAAIAAHAARAAAATAARAPLGSTNRTTHFAAPAYFTKETICGGAGGRLGALLCAHEFDMLTTLLRFDGNRDMLESPPPSAPPPHQSPQSRCLEEAHNLVAYMHQHETSSTVTASLLPLYSPLAGDREGQGGGAAGRHVPHGARDKAERRKQLTEELHQQFKTSRAASLYRIEHVGVDAAESALVVRIRSTAELLGVACSASLRLVLQACPGGGVVWSDLCRVWLGNMVLRTQAQPVNQSILSRCEQRWQYEICLE